MLRTMNWLHWSLLSALFAGFTAVLAKMGVNGMDSNLATAIRTSVVLPIIWIFAFTMGKPLAKGAYPGASWVPLILSGVATGLSWLCYFRALELGEASKVAPVDKLSVVFVILLAAVFLKERIGVQQVVGGGLVLAGAVVLAWDLAKA